VIICSLNGADGVDRALHALAAQTIARDLEIIVVDDGSTDATSDVAARHGVVVVRHELNRGLSAARNTGIRQATAENVAFLDDDCNPAPDWAGRLLDAYAPGVIGVGGIVVPKTPGNGPMASYLERHNPLEPLEIDLRKSEALPYRLLLYMKRQWIGATQIGRRPVHALVGANMSFRRDLIAEVAGFDERFAFGAEELDLCRRLELANPGTDFVLEPAARVVHHFEPSLADSVRRSRAYGVGSARMYRKWYGSRPTIFPFPFAVAGLALLGALQRRHRAGVVAALLAPHALLPGGLLDAVRRRHPHALLDPYIQLAQEAYGNVGFAEGWHRYRNFPTEPVERPGTTHPAPAVDAPRTVVSAPEREVVAS
jgi:glycosyltransferase involved in cell wall biosynthesis